ncbi:uncharacterized protein LOC130392787 [Gadus chalcogrammus]|uniref:uncharacterized protein LOC130392787 n=1 Tax=Gadus chalcogrammus TaxID=1042646 RepID=UPI0024C4C4FB|nr:uncharacterized protein LOC130392787 [Gadus chalcogrammus]
MHPRGDLSFAVEPMDNAPCAMGAQRPPVDTTGRPGGPAAAHRPRTAVRLPKFTGVTQLEPYLAQFRLAAWHNGWGAEEAVVHLALALEGTAARVLLDLDQADQRDLQALIQALERRLGERVSSNESKQLLASHRRREEESLGVHAADVQLLTRRSYPEFSAATREALALHAFLRGLQPESLGQHVRLTAPQTLDAALDQAERAEVELCRRRGGGSVDAAGAALPPGTKNVGVKSRQRKGRIRTATATETAEASLAQCRQLGLVEDCGWTWQRATHPRRSRRRGRRKARRRRAAEDGVPERRSRGPLQRNLVGAPMEVVPDHNPRTATDCWRQASQPEGKAAPQRGRYWPGPRRRRRPPEQSGLCSGCWGRRDV